jgi:hypothetical protein
METKMKYRIVKRNTNGFGDYMLNPWYYAQVRVLGIWFDLRHHPFHETHEMYDSYSPNYATVEKWLENYREEKMTKFQQEVVKTYE